MTRISPGVGIPLPKSFSEVHAEYRQESGVGLALPRARQVTFAGANLAIPNMIHLAEP